MPGTKAGDSEKTTKKHLQNERYLAFGFGVVFICTMLFVSIQVPDPSSFQYKVFMVVLSLAAAGFATTIPGFLTIEISNYIKAGGAIAVFIICYFASPAYLNIISTDKKWERQTLSYIAVSPTVFRVKISAEGNINVLEDSMKVYAKQVSITYPSAYNGVEKEYIDKFNVILSCIENTKEGRQYIPKLKSDFYGVDRWVDAGSTINLSNLDFEIQKTEEIKLSDCNIQFTVYVGNTNNGSGFVWGAPTPNIFK